ncbi:outer membrane beta-barrel protein [bacterium]|nr:outer membrane beta-barrel protein [bacterium]
MRRLFARSIPCGVFCVLFAATLVGDAHAFEESEGMRFGAFSLHPSVYTSIRYVDNIYFVPTDYEPETEATVPQEIESDFVFNLQPALNLRLRIPRFTLEAGYRFYNDSYLGDDDPNNVHSRLDATNHTFTGLLDYQSPPGIFVKGDDTYVVQKAFEQNAQYVDLVQGDQEHNEAHGTLGYRYGEEENLYIAGTYTNIWDQYAEPFELLNRRGNFGDGDLRLKFFPKTALVLQGGAGEYVYPENPDGDATVYYGMGGVTGQLTRVLRIILKGGYHVSDYAENDDYQGPIGQAELSALWSEDARVALGVRRQILDSSTTNFYVSDEVYLLLYRVWGHRLATEGYGSYQSNEFSDPFDRHEDYIQLRAELTLRLIYWLYLGGGYQYDTLQFDDGDTETTTNRNIYFLKLLAKF